MPIWEKPNKTPLTFPEAMRGMIAWWLIKLALDVMPKHFYEHPILDQAFRQLDENAEVYRRQR